MRGNTQARWIGIATLLLPLSCGGGGDEHDASPAVDASKDAQTATLHWYYTCGDPVCGIGPDPSDDLNVPNCTDEKAGQRCDVADALCDGIAGCGVKLVCAESDPTMRPGGCPISRARFKQDIAYLTGAELRHYHEQLMAVKLAAYRYKHAPDEGPQLGFIIDDLEPSVAVRGDHVNLYGYLSMAVAAIQVQERKIEALEKELASLREQLSGPPTPPMSRRPRP